MQILKIKKEKERLLATEKEREFKEKEKAIRGKWLGGCLRFMDYCIDPIPYDLPNLCQDGLEVINYITPEIRLKIKKAVLAILDDYGPESDPEEVRFIIQKTVGTVREECLCPVWKEENINIAIGTLERASPFPWWMDERIKDLITAEIEGILREKTTGLEDDTEVIKMAKGFKEKVVEAIDKIKWAERKRTDEEFLKEVMSMVQTLKEAWLTGADRNPLCRPSHLHQDERF